MKEMYRLLTHLKHHPGKRFALATVIRIEGSAYRRPPAKMLFDEDGGRVGTISAGCLEDDLFHHAEEAIRSRTPKSVVYDLRSVDDLSWGQGKGCNGTITVYVEPIGWDTPMIGKLHERLHAGEPVLICRSIGIQEPETKAAMRLFTVCGEPIAAPLDCPMNDALVLRLRQFRDRGIRFEFATVPELACDFVFERAEPKDPLYIFGAGPDAEPLARLASQYDFSITLIDPRSDRNDKHLFPTVDRFAVEHPESFLSRYEIPKHSFVIIMTHSFARDRTILRHLLHSPPRFTGVLGPRKRTERLLDVESVPDWIHSPIGLNIHADGPEEISISILAQIIQVRNKGRNEHERRNEAASGQRHP